MAFLGQYGDRLAEMTALEVIKAAREHLIGQGKQSLSSNGQCYYDNGEGLYCGAAPFLKKDGGWSEGNNWITLQESGGFANLFRGHDDLIYSIQIIHDDVDPEFWGEEFDRLEMEYELRSC